jgi:hypothetical protein
MEKHTVPIFRPVTKMYVFQTEQSETWTAASYLEVCACKDTQKSLEEDMSFLRTLLKERSEVLDHIKVDYEMLQVTRACILLYDIREW